MRFKYVGSQNGEASPETMQVLCYLFTLDGPYVDIPDRAHAEVFAKSSHFKAEVNDGGMEQSNAQGEDIAASRRSRGRASAVK